MTWQTFLGSEAAQRRYWSGAANGWERMQRFSPNAGHLALAALERAGYVRGVATQNVDSLHLRAGSRRVVELHGHLRTVHCLPHGHVETADSLLSRIRAENPWVSDEAAYDNPDGDAAIADDLVDTFVLPRCLECGGVLAPDVIMFGNVVAPENNRAATRLMNEADSLLVVGTSLVVNTGVKMVHRARRQGKPVMLVNRGATPVDALAQFRVDGSTSTVLERVAELLGVHQPRDDG
jgi:NAD-dependent SIR2 family protein deacetylase